MQNLAVAETMQRVITARTGCGQVVSLVFEEEKTICGESLVEAAHRVLPHVWITDVRPNTSESHELDIPVIGSGGLEPFPLTDTGEETRYLARFHEANVRLDNGQKVRFLCLSRLDGASFLALRVLNKAIQISILGELDHCVQDRFFEYLRDWADDQGLQPDIQHPVVMFRW
jgi:hypothetical protein